ncbi:hypothetical protein HDEF_1795 [Candidatus Hamiltonella defensa 5AT (Acyrthosiphon pisum)]|uniref:Uncharacterized protein n=1 Tax=Hamiltonella defensa subsp. Acyrthosiphon pisum (strain 5AT) TaxID=572265 RepID=C4K748_HAMD5|nr:hypothetical protein HDEF_1795 [Candidatus Hamiltonella defensa 5AT (Acyrthosiphon pisum)]
MLKKRIKNGKFTQDNQKIKTYSYYISIYKNLTLW